MIAIALKTISAQIKFLSKYEDILLRIGIILFFILAITLSSLPTDKIFETGVTAIADIASFVAFTLLIVSFFQYLIKTNISLTIERLPWLQVPFASLMGLLPGCGGAIIVVTQFIYGRLSFGSLVATLIATMGDAMFLLMSTRPKSALIVILVSAPTAIIFGYIIDLIHSTDFLRPKKNNASNKKTIQETKKWSNDLTPFDIGWLIIMLIMTLFSIPWKMFEFNLFSFLGITSHFLLICAFIFALISVVYWIFQGNPDMRYEGKECKKGCTNITRNQSILKSIITTTNFVLSWALIAMIVFELIIHIFNLNIESWLKSSALFLPLIAILIGFIPGCGPQVMTAALHASGNLPLSAQLGNSISNDGDALFPAIAATPKAASLATLYSAIPAFIIAYGCYFLLGL